MTAAAVLAGGLLGGPASAQEREEDKPRTRETTVVQTFDGVTLALDYYPVGTEKKPNKDAIPVVLLHSWKGSRVEFATLARDLNAMGHAVIVPDLRGHGGSTSKRIGQRTATLEAAKLSAQDFRDMCLHDVIALKNFLWEKNNAEELNIDKLCLVGSEMGATIALQWALLDALGYEHRQIRFGPLQLGRFVKAVVLLSPEWVFQRISAKQALDNPVVRDEISMLVMVGKGDAKAVGEARQIVNILERNRPAPAADDPDRDAKRTLIPHGLDTSLQGSKMLEVRTLGIEKSIGRFIQLRLAAAPEAAAWKWELRKRPHE